ncbi:MFS transporter [Nonomuraea sp. NEAU-A123]|uniref:MFS transporter n=1 Tax=Nonomuraea sp. NEAU-A123 TaxID=2839649 RepID=UPI001BE3DD0F|nr:MFS transporter [Nonomuraea sp. NEAU-A123]MBT2226617.1 MFS transporter [Nonomuraea sp. NEAU-A123]
MSPVPSRLPGIALLALLRGNPDFRRLFLASALSLTGDWFAFVALNAFVYHRTGSAGLTALLFAVESLPGILLMPLIGSLTDRLDRRRLRIACDLAAIVPLAGLLAAFHLGSVPMALVSLAVLSVSAAMSSPIPEVVLPNLVAPDRLPIAQATLGSLYSSSLLLGAGLGGLVTAAWGSTATLLIDAASFAASAVLIARIRRPFSTAPATRRMRVRTDTSELWRFIRGTPTVAALLWLTAALRLCYGIVGLLPVYALERFGATDAGVGVLYLAQGAGSMLGPFLGRRLVGASPTRRLLVPGGALAVFGLGYLALAQAGSLWSGIPAAMAGHLGVGACAILAINGLQVASPDHIRGRVMVAAFGVSSGLQGVSSLAVAPLTVAVGMTGATRLLGVLAVGFALVWLLYALRLRKPTGEIGPPAPDR